MYRVTSVTCLCGGQLEETTPGRRGCASCGFVMVSVEAFVELMRVAAPDVDVPRKTFAIPRPGPRRRPCPICRKLMIHGVLFEQAVEQCFVDGLYLHADTLTKIVMAASERFEQRLRG